MFIREEDESSYISLELIADKILLTTHLGSVITTISFQTGVWYRITITLLKNKLTLHINHKIDALKDFNSNVMQIAPNGFELFEIGSSSLTQSSFEGCLQNITIAHNGVLDYINPILVALEGYGLTQCVFSRTCSPSLCSEHGLCYITDDYQIDCDCYREFTGPRCETGIYECKKQDCENGGHCIVEETTHGLNDVCNCPFPYAGDKCQTSKSF